MTAMLGFEPYRGSKTLARSRPADQAFEAARERGERGLCT